MSPPSLPLVYGTVPMVPCKGLCQEACGPIAFSGVEAEALQDAGVALPVLVDHPVHGAMACSHLTKEGRCAVYEKRPLVCRLFGAVKAMKCPHGCMPDGGYLSDEESRGLLRQLYAEDAARGLPPYVSR